MRTSNPFRRVVLTLALVASCCLALIMPAPKVKHDAVVTAEAQSLCDYAHEACQSAWMADWYTSCIILGDNTDFGIGYDGCWCRAVRKYDSCMAAHGCSSKGRAWLQEAGSTNCLTPQ
jgi:hypothetical protein